MPVNSFLNHPLSWTPPEGVVGVRPVYLSLAAALEDDIRKGTLCPGMKLPPQRELADFLDIDFTTVTRAYNLCREKRLVYGVTGRGTFVASQDPSDLADEGVDCAVVQGFPGCGTDEIAAAARDVLSRSGAAGLFSYRDRDGSRAAISAGVRWLESCGVNADVGRVAVFPGAQGAISAVLFSLFRPGDAVAVDEFTYSNFISLSRLAHLKLVPVQADGEGMRADLLALAVSKSPVRGVFIMPRNANPTGRSVSEGRKREIAAVASANDLLLIEDDARLLPPCRSERTFFSLAPENTIYIAGSTRNIAPGLRATFIAFSERHRSRVLNALHHLAIKAGALDAEILAEIILSGRAERILRAKAALSRAANGVFDAIFPEAPKAAEDALFRVLPLPGSAGRGQEVEITCRKAGVRICHSDRFSVRAGSRDSFVRVSVSSAPDLPRLRQGLNILSRVLRGGFSPTARTGGS